MNLTKEQLQIIYQFFNYLKIDSDKISISLDKDTLNITIDLPEEDMGIYIGRYASTLDSIQLLISLFLRNQNIDFIHHVYLDVGGYRQRRQQTLQDMASRIAQEVINTNSARVFSPLSATERRAIHLIFQNHESLTTYSEGQGYQRRLVLAPKNR